ncbi:DUF3293 domain-containing protein [Haloferula sargassicola]|uniref:DUF3293 domain-containing protein n=1 Tax=Haloferula sargassicola TaxID=490096 RepID=A0ABP9UHG1_9BACT
MTGRFPAGYYDCRFSWENGAPDWPAFAIVTAHNPMDRRWSGRMNRAADHRLRRLLERRLLAHVRVTCSSPDGSHAEPGWAVRSDRDTALAIARRYKQRAIWWIEHGDLHLVSCREHHSERVGVWNASFSPPPEDAS